MKKLCKYGLPCVAVIARYQGKPTRAKTATAVSTPLAEILTERRSSHQIGARTTPGTATATGPFMRNPRPPHTPAAIHQRLAPARPASSPAAIVAVMHA